MVGAKVPAMIAFGDSSVDAGNNNYIATVARSNFQPYGRDFVGGKPTGRFSNGRIATDFLSQAFGIKPYVPPYLDPNHNISHFATGVSFASAATGYDNATSDVLERPATNVRPSASHFPILWFCSLVVAMEVFEGGAFDLGDMGPDAEDGNGASEFKRERWVVWIWIWPLVNGRTVSVIPLWKQLEYYKGYQKKLSVYLGESRANETVAKALHIISLGTNDFLENYFAIPGRASQYTPREYQNFLAGIAENFIYKLYGLGARKISLGGLPPMGCLPLERTTNFVGGNECVSNYNNIALEFNDNLSKLTTKLKKDLPGIRLVFSNPYDILLQIIKRPAQYGFQVTSMACCATGMFEMGYACSRASSFSCIDASRYVFWDSFHPTEKTNGIIAKYLVKNALAQFLH
ncbi:hypothetical protein JHK82_035043 [Glycine max]|nr:hypothetical protein JHK85_035780 [Glycine max]KAG5111774.1 hypothetical protein JHK82_035043 [Glycine max]KAG5129060.1 hypothetical protein JHK84_035457 [Glycine max]